MEIEDYLIAVKELRTENKYNYTDEVLKEYEYYFKDCCKSNLSVYKSLEWLSFQINGEKYIRDMVKYSLQQYIEMSERFNKMSFYEKIKTVKNNSDILTLASDGNWWGIKIKDKEIWVEFEDDYDFQIEREWGSSEMYDLISLLGIENTDL